MTRHSLHMIGLALAGLGVLAAAAAQAQTNAADVDCASYLAMDEGQRNAIAAVVEGTLEAATPAAPAVDANVLLDAGIDPAAVVATPAPMPGETARVLTEACTATGSGKVLDALSAGQPEVEVATPTDG